MGGLRNVIGHYLNMSTHTRRSWSSQIRPVALLVLVVLTAFGAGSCHGDSGVIVAIENRLGETARYTTGFADIDATMPFDVKEYFVRSGYYDAADWPNTSDRLLAHGESIKMVELEPTEVERATTKFFISAWRSDGTILFEKFIPWSDFESRDRVYDREVTIVMTPK